MNKYEFDAITCNINKELDVVKARLMARDMAAEIGFKKAEQYQIATAVSELAQNIVKYADYGEIEIRPIAHHLQKGIQIRAVDQGPGIAEIATALDDHYSTGGTLGLGLSGVKRLMDEMIIDTEYTDGVRVTAKKWIHKISKELMRSKAVTASATRPYKGEQVCGDLAWVQYYEDCVFLAVIDAAGHGPEAAAIANDCKSIFNAHYSDELEQIIQLLHDYAKGLSRGLVAGLCRVQITTGLMEYCGMGNIDVRIFGKQSRRFVSRDGVIGYQITKPITEDYILNDGDVLLMSTDGISTRFDLKDYPQIFLDNVDDVCETIISQFGKHDDDCGCLSMRFSL